MTIISNNGVVKQMAMKIERMTVKNTQRGKATLLARFDVNFGPMAVKGFELVRVGDSVFVSEPYNLYTPKGESQPKRFTYVFFNGEKGKAMQKEISDAAKDEYSRRNGAGGQDQYQNQYGGGYQQPNQGGQYPPQQPQGPPPPPPNAPQQGNAPQERYAPPPAQPPQQPASVGLGFNDPPEDDLPF